MKIQYASDLHFEFSNNYSYLKRNSLKPVGNHELYKYYDLAKMPQGLVYAIRDNVRCYYNAVVQFDNIDIVVSTLWAKIKLEDAFATERGVSDFHRILYDDELLTWEKFNQEHEKCFLKILDLRPFTPKYRQNYRQNSLCYESVGVCLP